MKDFDNNKESSYLKYWYLNNLYSWEMSQKCPVNDFKWVDNFFEFDESFIKSYNDERDEGYFLEVDVQYPEKLHDLHNDLLFLSEGMKLENIQKIIANLGDKTEYDIYMKNLKQALNHELVLTKFQRVIKFNQKAWLQSDINMNIDLRKLGKNDFE